MKKSTYSKTISLVILAAMLIGTFLLISFTAATETNAGSIAIPGINEMMKVNSPDLVKLISFAEEQTPGYGSNGKFLAPIEDPDSNAAEIHTAQQLYDVRNNLSGSFVLMNDIDLSGFNSGQWVPIGDDVVEFTGTFDGQGYVIKNLTITGGAYNYNGLFGFSSGGAIIKNIGLENLRIEASSPAFTSGGICGFNYYSTIFNCYNTGDISSPYGSSYAGGICGIGSGSISYCYNTGKLPAFGNTGGISGHSYGSISYCYNSGGFSSSGSTGGICGTGYGFISNCYNTGIISSSNHAGGICGSADWSHTTISFSNCINTGDISSARAGGICGYSSGTDSISYCYNTGNISSTSAAGGICAISYNAGTISDCYNTGDISSFSTYYDSETWAGGICGTGNSLISNCYTTGSISSTNSSTDLDYPSHAGGICGSNISSNSISNCVILSGSINANNTSIPTNITSYLVADGGTKANNLALIGISGNAIYDASGQIYLTEAKSQSTYENDLGWDFRTVWKMDPDGYPLLRWTLDDDATLSGIILSTGELNPVFHKETIDYTVHVSYEITSITITATANHKSAGLSGALAGTGTGTSTKALSVGSNSFSITVAAENGITTKTYTVTIIREEPSAIIKLAVSSAEGRAGREVTLTVSLENNPGIASYGITMQYDKSRLTYVSATKGDIKTDTFYARDNNYFHELADNQINFNAYTLEGEAIKTGSDLFTVRFKINEETEPCIIDGDDLKFDYVLVGRDGFAISGTEVIYPFVKQGSISVTNVLYGDVNGDEKVDRADQVRLNQYFSGLDASENNFEKANADVNGDGELNRADQVRLNQYFSGLDTRPLGPIKQPAELQIPTLVPISLIEPNIKISDESAKVGEEVTLTVSLKDSPGIASYGITMQYDKSRLEYVSATRGDIITDTFYARDKNYFSDLADNQINFNGYTLEGEISKAGSVLFAVTFRIKDEIGPGVIDGDSLKFDYFLVGRDGFAISGTEVIYPILFQGSVTVTDSQSGLIVSGIVKSYYPTKPATIQLIKNEEPVYTAMIRDEDGYGLKDQVFTFEGVAPDTYDLVVTKDAHTKFTVKDVVAGEEDLDLTLDDRPEIQIITLRCGDINGDGLINDADLTILWRAGNYNKKAGEAENPRCDLNGDGLINDADLTMLWLAHNYNRGAVVIEY